MNFDDQATRAGASISTRSEALTPHRSGLIRKRWVAPAGIAALLLIVLGAASLVGLGRGATSRVETVAGLDGPSPIVDGVGDRLLAGFVSVDGAVTILSGDPDSPTIQRLRADAPPPILDMPTIPKPRWAFGGRVIEYVTQHDDGAETVRVDVPTGRVSTATFSVPELTSRGIAGLLDAPFGTGASDLTLMRASDGFFVSAVGEGDDAKWWVRDFRPDRGRLYDIDSIEFLAPGLESLIVIAEGSLSQIDSNRGIQAYQPEGVAEMAARSAAVASTGETALGFDDATVVAETSDGLASFELGEQFGAVTELSWDPTGASLFVHTLSFDAGLQAWHQCPVREFACRRVEIDATGSLVRGSPLGPPASDVLNIWPGEAVSIRRTNVEPWRRDPQLLATRFATELFGWDRPLVVESEFLSLYQQQIGFDLRRSAEDPVFRITVAQAEGQAGWFVSKVRSRSDGLGMRYESPVDGIASVQIERLGAAVVEVTLNIEGVEVSGRATAGDEIKLDFRDDRFVLGETEPFSSFPEGYVEIKFDFGEHRFDQGPTEPYSGFPGNVGYSFVRFRDEDGAVFDAVSFALVPSFRLGPPLG